MHLFNPFFVGLIILRLALYSEGYSSSSSDSTSSSSSDSSSSPSLTHTNAVPSAQLHLTSKTALVSLPPLNDAPQKLSRPDLSAKILSKSEISELKKMRKRVKNANYAREKRLANPNHAAEAARKYREKRKQDPKRQEEYRAYRREYERRARLKKAHQLIQPTVSSAGKRKAEDVKGDPDYRAKRVRSNSTIAHPDNSAGNQTELQKVPATTNQHRDRPKSRNILRFKLSPEALKKYHADKQQGTSKDK
ncbi:uncharacterized protein FA14DRAFT_177842 [Meira miltonrushii]|uniref:BZIP domain-containing protein n=1 Tax=Meira miltonrushii TaxID=1280837 RepID=A0A316VLT0_9BASI|nr:uncharacterized protein FA14DRAFT_177842 [Meira miltonrushii]PWN38579.1 hypothetical protein FA14DRAFT_177842 [Meira miltonrushii]